MALIASAAPARRPAATQVLASLRRALPGVALCGVIALAATFVSRQYGGPLFLYALLLGMSLNALGDNDQARAGIELCMKWLLRLGVALLGARIALADIASLGWATGLLVIACVASTLAMGWCLARLLRLSPAQGLLSGGATAICGASAALAIAAVLPRSREQERFTLLVVVGVSALSTMAMLIYPMITAALGLTPLLTGVFLGVSIHDVAQVVGAAFIAGPAVGEPAIIVKLARVALLAAVVLGVGIWSRTSLPNPDEGEAARKPPLLPWFLLMFLALAALNTAGGVPAAMQAPIGDLSRALLVMAIAALGLRTSVAALREAGWRPLLLMVGETLWLGLLALAGVLWMASR
jgi:uncharacterized integral membrane protein (TIGR00698 family)